MARIKSEKNTKYLLGPTIKGGKHHHVHHDTEAHRMGPKKPHKPPGAVFGGGFGTGGGRGNRANDPSGGRTGGNQGRHHGDGDQGNRGGRSDDQGHRGGKGGLEGASRKGPGKAREPRPVLASKSAGASSSSSSGRRASEATGRTVVAPAQGGAKAKAAAAGAGLKSLKSLWRKEGRCFVCGSESHKIAECPNKSDSHQSSGGASGKGAGVSTGSKSNPKPRAKTTESNTRSSGPADQTGRKRQRSALSATASGFTPPAKKSTPNPSGKEATKSTKSQRFSYAKAAAGAKQLAILRQDGSHIARREFGALQVEMNKEFMEILRADGWVPSVDEWIYSSTTAVVSISDARSCEAITDGIKKLGFEVKDLEELREERRPTKILSGLITGPTAKFDETVLAELLKHQIKEHKIAGRIEAADKIPTKAGNAILRLRVDDIAMQRLQELEFTLRFAMAGRVLFQEVKQDKTTKVNKEPISDLQARRDEIQKRLDELEKEKAAELESLAAVEAERAELASVSSMGLSGLSVTEEQAGMETGDDAQEKDSASEQNAS